MITYKDSLKQKIHETEKAIFSLLEDLDSLIQEIEYDIVDDELVCREEDKELLTKIDFINLRGILNVRQQRTK